MSRKLFYLIALIIFIPGLTGCPDGAKSGSAQMSLFAGNIDIATGSTDGTGEAASFNSPTGVSTDSTGNIYVADSNNHTIRKITPAGVVTTLTGAAGQAGSTDATGAAARFSSPKGVATDSAGNVYVADFANNTIRKVNPAGVVTTLAGTAGTSGSTDGTGTAARFNSPFGIATDSTGNVYVTDIADSTIRKVTPAGVVTTLAGTAASFSSPYGVAADSTGNVYVADTSNHTIRKITPAGVVTTLAGTAGATGSTDGTGAAARFNYPFGVATDSADNVYVADTSNRIIRKITPAGVVTTLAGTAGTIGATNGTGTTASFNSPFGLATDSTGNVYVADTSNHTIRKITPAGVVTTLAGTASPLGTTDGTGAAARFNSPLGVAADSAGNIFVADTSNHTIRKITPAGIVTTLAGTAGAIGATDDTSGAARFAYPTAITIDSTGNVYVTDNENSTIRKITQAGEVTTLAGTAGYTGSTDASGAAARFRYPKGIATDTAGNVYVADSSNHTIRKITSAGEVTTLAGTAGTTGSTDGMGSAALFRYPMGIATDSGGNVFVADYGNSTIRKITPAGVITTFAGTAGKTGATDASGAAARFYGPRGVATDSAGNVYVADTFNSTIRKITPSGVVTTLAGTAGVSGFIPGGLPGIIPQPQYLAISGSSMYLTGNNGVIRLSNLP